MDRLACVNVDRLPVQLLCRQDNWRTLPVAWVDREAATGQVLQVNDRAGRLGVQPGMRYARALSLAPRLRAAPLTEVALGEQVAALTRCLQGFSPEVEAATEPGLFWLNGAGLGRVFRSPARWAGEIREALRALGFAASVVVGFDRFATAALARGEQGQCVLTDPTAERQALAAVPLAQVIREPELLATLRKLGLRRLGEYEALPAAGRRERFGQPAALRERHRRFSPAALVEPCTVAQMLGEPVADTAALLALLDELLAALWPRIQRRDRRVAALHVHLELENRSEETLRLEPATPTLETLPFRRLAALKLETLDLPAGVQEMRLTADLAAAGAAQLALFSVRDRVAANEALAELRARYGEDAVVRARLHAEWLPGRDFVWEPLRALPDSVASRPRSHRLVRRLLDEPRSLPSVATGTLPLPDVSRYYGPFRFTGGWWTQPYDQTHYLAATADGKLAWLAYDHPTRRWHLLGHVD